MKQVRANPDFGPSTRDWAALLRTNCLTLTLAANPPDAVSLSRGFPDGSETKRDAFVELARRLAEEYRIVSKVESHSGYVTIRYTRPDAAATIDAGNSASVLDKAGAWLKARFGRARQPSEAPS